MTSPMSETGENSDNVKETNPIRTIHHIYRENNDEIISRDPTLRRSFISRPAYAKLHRSFSSGNKRHSVDNLKGRFETLAKENDLEPTSGLISNATVAKEEVKVGSFSPEIFGYPKNAKLKPPILKPKPVIPKRQKDENFNLVVKDSRDSSNVEEAHIVLQPSASEESVYKIAKELESFEENYDMDGKLNRKRSSSLRKFLGIFGKDKKKKEEEKKQKSEIVNDNIKNESNFNRQSPHRQSAPTKMRPVQEAHEEKVRELEQEYAKLHVNRFNQIRQNFDGDKVDDYIISDKVNVKPTVENYVSGHVNRYIDTSSSASTEPEQANSVVRVTPPRAQETNQNTRMVKPKVSVPISSEKPLPNPYQNGNTSPRTIERNLNRNDGKDYPDKANLSEESYVSGDMKPINSKPLPSPAKLESTKLKLPSNREIYEPQPRVKSPIPSNRISTDKIIATELLKNSRSPTPPKRTSSVPREYDAAAAAKPPVPLKKHEVQTDRIITNAQVHAPRRLQTSADNSWSTSRATTPIDLRMSVSMKTSPNRDEVRKSIEEYYWKELKKLKEEEDSKLYFLQSNGYYEDPARVKRSRSLSPHRASRRSLSLPRDGNRANYVISPQQSIPEDHAVTVANRQNIYQQNFIRDNPERRSVDSLQRPIFRRGSLTKQEVYELPTYNKKVSFSNGQQAWPTRNGYVQSPPQRRLGRVDSELDDEVFLPNSAYGHGYFSVEAVHNRVPPQNEPLYANKVIQRFRQGYIQQPQMGNKRLSMDSIPRQDAYGPRPQLAFRRPTSNIPIDDYGRSIQSFVNLQRNPVYSSRQSMTDSNYGQRQITVSNKYCDIYGQIHEVIPAHGVVMGQIQNSPLVLPRQPESFVRGSRLTASAIDLGRRYETNERSTTYINRPLPPLPSKSTRNAQISDTESGSDASEVQRIMQNKTKNKKKGLFGK